MNEHRYMVKIQARFEAAHFLRQYRGICEPLHGHSYLVEAELSAPDGGLDEDDLAIDFVASKRELERLAKRLDYGCINEVPPFDSINPSAENIARWFHDELRAALGAETMRVAAIVIWEGPTNSVRFEPAG
ncbi:MAG: 6-pyruvoyl trahydropterin synthase family protein [Thermoanaerobaculia bacterium]